MALNKALKGHSQSAHCVWNNGQSAVISANFAFLCAFVAIESCECGFDFAPSESSSFYVLDLYIVSVSNCRLFHVKISIWCAIIFGVEACLLLSKCMVALLLEYGCFRHAR